MPKFKEMLGEEFDYDVVAGDQMIGSAVCWDPDIQLTELAQEKFRDVLEAECSVENGFLVFQEVSYELVNTFVWALAGYIPVSEYESYFTWIDSADDQFEVF